MMLQISKFQYQIISRAEREQIHGAGLLISQDTISSYDGKDTSDSRGGSAHANQSLHKVTGTVSLDSEASYANADNCTCTANPTVANIHESDSNLPDNSVSIQVHSNGGIQPRQPCTSGLRNSARQSHTGDTLREEGVLPHSLAGSGNADSAAAADMADDEARGRCFVCEDATAEAVLLKCGHGGLCTGKRQRSHSQYPDDVISLSFHVPLSLIPPPLRTRVAQGARGGFGARRCGRARCAAGTSPGSSELSAARAPWC
jgi:hypothetical protein